MAILSLTDVKINNSYTYVESVAPTIAEKEPAYTNGQTWLDIVTGYSYSLADQVTGTWQQIETGIDARINLLADDVLLTANKAINNFFIVPRNAPYFELDLDNRFPDHFTTREQFELIRNETVVSLWNFDAGTKMLTGGTDIFGDLTTFVSGDLVYVKGSRRNDGYYTVSMVTATSITFVEDIQNGDAWAWVSLTDIPQGYLNIIGRMVHFDIYERNEAGQGMKAENWGTYSYTKFDVLNGLGYPDQVLSGIDAYEGIVLGGQSVFVN